MVVRIGEVVMATAPAAEAEAEETTLAAPVFAGTPAPWAVLAVFTECAAVYALEQ